MSRNITIAKYLDKLAARSPVPGGGSAAALTGALGISLLSMAARFMLKREKKRAARKKLAGILKFSEKTRRRLAMLMGKDEAAYLRLSEAIKKRSAKDAAGLYKDAAEIPLEVLTLLESAFGRCGELCLHCRTSIISDLALGALLIEAGFYSAKVNVEINARGIKDSTYVRKINGVLLKRKSAVVKRKKKIARTINSKIKGLL